MIERNENIIKFEKALSADENLRNKYEAALKKISDEKLAESDGEAMVKAAKELGYEISIDEMERAFAAIQELDDEEFDMLAAGQKQAEYCGDKLLKAEDKQDEYGHDGFCWSVWHCVAAFLHTETDSKEVSCWSDYMCVALYE